MRRSARPRRAHCSRRAALGRQPQRRPAPVRARRLRCTSAPATARNGRQRPDRELRARQDPADRRADRRGAPATRSAAASGRTACATRGASASTALTGDMLIGDVGDGTWEEIDWATAATGRGARRRTSAGRAARAPRRPSPSSCGTSTLTPPAFARSQRRRLPRDRRRLRGARPRAADARTAATCTATTALSATLRSVALPDTGDRAEPLPVSQLTSFGEDACGRIYVASHGGPVYRIQDGAPTPCNVPAPRPPPRARHDAAAPSAARADPARLAQAPPAAGRGHVRRGLPGRGRQPAARASARSRPARRLARRRTSGRVVRVKTEPQDDAAAAPRAAGAAASCAWRSRCGPPTRQATRPS